MHSVRRPPLTPLIGILLFIALIPGAASCIQVPLAPSPTATTVPPDPARLIFGTNMALYDANDQLLTNLATRKLFTRAHIPIIRVPSRFNVSDVDMIKALQAIRSVGAIPLVILHGPTDANMLADDHHVITLVQGVFGADTVYMEFGNEPDLAGIDVEHYSTAWNQVIPTLKRMAPTYKFVGPVTFQADPAYIAAFDASASPRPDANSWHEYACHSGSSDADCLDRLADWTMHIQQTNIAVRAAIGTTLPNMITEWNLDASPDVRYTNAGFMATWTTHALQTLRANVPNGLLAAMQYCATSNPHLSLVDSNNSLTPEGQALFSMLAGSSSATVTTP